MKPAHCLPDFLLEALGCSGDGDSTQVFATFYPSLSYFHCALRDLQFVNDSLKWGGKMLNNLAVAHRLIDAIIKFQGLGAGFVNLGTLDMWHWMILCGGHHCVHRV